MNSLVSVCVVTYNSAATIVDTLESIKAQTYQNLELVVSDDCSKDDTVKVCREWIAANKDRFAAATVIESEVNTGVSANCNRGFSYAKGGWIKVIAGDDTLMADCVRINMDYVDRNPSVDILFSRIHAFGEAEKVTRYESRFKYGYFYMSPKSFKYRLLTGNFLPAPTSFIRKSSYLALGGFDESVPHIEDWPFWIKASFNDCRIDFINKVTVNYRMAETSSSMSSRKSVFFINSMLQAKKYADTFLRKTSFLLWIYIRCVYDGDSRFLKLISYIIRLFNPVLYYLKYNEYKADRITKNIIASADGR